MIVNINSRKSSLKCNSTMQTNKAKLNLPSYDHKRDFEQTWSILVQSYILVQPAKVCFAAGIMHYYLSLNIQWLQLSWNSLMHCMNKSTVIRCKINLGNKDRTLAMLIKFSKFSFSIQIKCISDNFPLLLL